MPVDCKSTVSRYYYPNRLTKAKGHVAEAIRAMWSDCYLFFCFLLHSQNRAHFLTDYSVRFHNISTFGGQPTRNDCEWVEGLLRTFAGYAGRYIIYSGLTSPLCLCSLFLFVLLACQRTSTSSLPPYGARVDSSERPAPIFPFSFLCF